jgi:RsiW-degrading membrane proteinase PrsW (M82 family)
VLAAAQPLDRSVRPMYDAIKFHHRLISEEKTTMKTWGILFVQYLINLVMLRFADEPMMPSEDEKKKLPTWAIILIVLGGLIVLCIIVSCLLFFLGPLLFGPAIGNVFSNVVEEIE